MGNEEKTLAKFWGVFGGLIIIVIGAAIMMSNRMAVIEERVENITINLAEDDKKVSHLDKDLRAMKDLLIEINTKQEILLEKLNEEN